MLNQLRFKRDDFREFSFHFHKVIIDKDEVMNFLYQSKQMIQQSNNIARN